MIDYDKVAKNIKEREQWSKEAWEELKEGMEEDPICRDEGEEDWDSIIKYGGQDE